MATEGGGGGVDPDNIYLSWLGSAIFDLVKARSNRLLPSPDKELQLPSIIRVNRARALQELFSVMESVCDKNGSVQTELVYIKKGCKWSQFVARKVQGKWS